MLIPQALEGERSTFDAVADGGFILLVALIAIIVGRLSRILAGGVIRYLASRSLLGANSAWRVRVPRLVAETVPIAELRRDHRLTAAAAMIGRLLKVVIWLVAVIVVLDRLEVDLIIAVSGAGFLGAAVAIGGQNSVHDYLNGLHVLLEDRFGEGDTVKVLLDSGGEFVNGTVTRLGAFATRIETAEGTFHLANRRAAQVMNLSQREYPRLFDLRIPRDGPSGPTLTAEIARAVTIATEQSLPDGAPGFVLDSAERVDSPRRRATVRVNGRFGRALTDEELNRVVQAANEQLALGDGQ